jgi:MoaA/NifB/PqqE/SkfB family radical SAM enzyme
MDQGPETVMSDVLDAAPPATAQDVLSPDEAFFPRIPPLNIELSSRCNLKCPYCANPTLTRDYESLPDHLFDKVVAEARITGTPIWSLHGVGEPLLRRDLEDLMRKLDATGLWSKWVVTNGVLLHPERMKSLYEAGLRGFYNSVDSLDPDMFKRTRGGKIEKIIANVQAAAAAFPDVTIMVGLMNHKEQVVGDAERALFDRHYGHLPNVSMHVYENGRFPGAAEDWRRAGFDGLGETCYTPASNLTIDARGKVALCCADQNTEHVLGDVATRTLGEIWYDPDTQDVLRRIGLGLKACPSVCYRCVMKPTERSLDEVDPVLWGPFSQLLAAGTRAREAGDIRQAKTYMDFALKRDPLNADVKAAVVELEALTGVKDRAYFQQYADGEL